MSDYGKLPRKEERTLVSELISQLKNKEQWEIESYDTSTSYAKIKNKLNTLRFKMSSKGIKLTHPSNVAFTYWGRIKLRFYFNKVYFYILNIEERKKQSEILKELGDLISLPSSSFVTEVQNIPLFDNPSPEYKAGSWAN